MSVLLYISNDVYKLALALLIYNTLLILPSILIELFPVIPLKKNTSPYTFSVAFNTVSLLITAVPLTCNDEFIV